MIVGGRYNFSDILSKQGGTMYHSGNIPNMPNAGTPYIIVNYGGGNIRILSWAGGDIGDFDVAYQLTADEVATATGESSDDDDDDGDSPDGGYKPPTFPSTGPVFTPLDPAGIAQRNYSKYYPEYTAAPTVRAASAYPTMGLLSDPYGGADVDLYQPWSAKYGANVAPSNLWNYEPPSGLDVGPGPKVGFV